MKGKVIVHAPADNMGLTKLFVYINGQKIAALVRNEKSEFKVKQDCALTVQIGFSETRTVTPMSDPISIPVGKQTEIECNKKTVNKFLGTFIVIPSITNQIDYIEEEPQQDEQPQDTQKEALQRIAEKNGYKLTAREMQLMALNAGCMESTALNAAAGFNHIATSVRPDEKVVFCIATGPIYARQHSLGNSAVVLTESRLIFAGGTSDFVKTVSSFSLDLVRIDAIDMQAQIMAYNLMITASGEQTKCTFAAMKDENGARLLNEFINAVYDCKKSKSEEKQQTNIINQVSAADEIKKFKELLDLGIITQEEFDAKKKQLLGL